jgi:hypothetical protein
MRTWAFFIVVTLGTAAAGSGCASFNRAGGASGAAVVAGETKTERAESGAATDSVATNGSDTTGEAVASSARPHEVPR